MIGKLKGKVHEIEGNLGLIETSSGLFYRVFLTPELISSSPPGKDLEIYTYLQVRDDALVLFGFDTKDEYRMFTALLTVPGVGPKTAFSVVSFTSVNDLTAAIKSNNADYFTHIPGLGKKTALKIMLELSQKMNSEFSLEKAYLSENDKTVVDALVSLGYSRQEAQNMLQKIPKDMTIENKIKEALKLSSQAKKRV